MGYGYIYSEDCLDFLDETKAKSLVVAFCAVAGGAIALLSDGFASPELIGMGFGLGALVGVWVNQFATGSAWIAGQIGGLICGVAAAIMIGGESGISFGDIFTLFGDWDLPAYPSGILFGVLAQTGFEYTHRALHAGYKGLQAIGIAPKPEFS